MLGFCRLLLRFLGIYVPEQGAGQRNVDNSRNKTQVIRNKYISKGGSGLELGGRLEAWSTGTFIGH